MNEVWVPLVGYEGFYVVSDKGRVKSVNDKRKYKWVNERIIKNVVSRLGYLQVGLSCENKCITKRLSRLVLESFVAVHTAFPRLVRSGSALQAVRLLVELLADDAAVRAVGPTPVARALVACAAARTPAGAMAAGGPTTVIRVRRLSGPPNSALLSLVAYLAAAAVLVVPTIAVAVPWLTELHRIFRP
jgi:hypothetical protein